MRLKRFLALVVSLAMVLTMMPAGLMVSASESVIDMSAATGNITVTSDCTVSGTSVYSLIVNGDATVTLNGLNITAASDSAISIESGNVTLVVDGDVKLTGGDNGAGIYVAETASVTIKDTDAADDKLTAIGNAGVDDESGAAGIGGTWANGNSGAITVDGATVVAEGYGVHGAGIGSGSGKVVGEIKIVNGADVTAQGGYYADGAGTCLQSSYGKTDPEGSAAIGGGGKTASEIAAIIITDSTVVANGGSKAAGIGANFWCSVDAITITGSTVTAQGGSSSAGIGTSRAGDTGVSANIEITNSTVNATGGDYGAGIGAGYNADSLGNGADASALPVTEISITGGTINATGGQGSAAIGGGYKTDNVDINIDGTANVTATAGALVSGKTVVNGGAPSAIGTGANGSGVFKNSPAAEIAETAAITVFAYEGEGAKTAVEGIANDQLAEMANVTVIDVNTVAMIGNTTYDSLAAAVTAAKAGDTIVLYQDVDSMPSINKAITIKGGVAGVEVNGAVAENFPNVDGTVTFENLTFNNRVSTENNSSDQSNMTLAFKNCTFNISENTYAIQGGSTASTPGNDVLGGLVIENCTFNASASSTNYMVYAQCVNTLTVTGSTFNGKDMYKGAIHTGDSTEQATVATISGNTISGVARGVQIGNRVEGSSVAVDGNTFTNVTTAADSKSGAVYVHGNADANVAVSVTDNTATDCTNVMYNDGNVIAEIVATYENNTKDGVAIYIDADGKDTTEAPVAIAKVNGVGYATFDDAITAANALTGDVTVELYGKVEYTATTANLTGSYDTINFVGKTDDAEISITRNGSNGYIAGTANSTPDVNFTDLILSKPTGAFVNDAGFMNQYFTVYRAGDVTYTNCVFPDGACAQGTSEDSDVTYTNCEFANQTSGEYSLWVYANVNVTVTGGKFTGVRGAKMYAEGAAKTGNLIMTNTVFTESVTQKPAIVLTYGESVTLSGNTYPTKGVFELDLDGAPNGTPVTTDTNTITCVNDNGACGVLVDGKIYTTVAQAAKVATSGSTVTLLHDSTETVELAEGVTLDKNGYEAANVTVASSIAGTITSCLVNLSDPAETFISSEITGLKATESVEIKLYSGETQIATTTLKKPEYFNMSTLGVKIIITGESSSWETVWADGMPRADVIPDKVVLYVDGQEMNSANVPMISTDGEAAVDWAEVPGVNPVGPVEVDTYNELVQALAEGKAVKLTADITATGAVDGTDANIDLNGKKLTLTVGGTNFYGDSTVSNGTIDITGCVASGDCIIGIGDYSNTATLTLDNVNVTGDGYSSAYAVLYVYNTSTLNVNGGSIVVSNDNASAGGVIKAHSAANGKINITGTESDPVELTFTDAKIGILDGTVVMDYVDLDITGGANAINQSALTVKNSTLTIKNCDGRALTLNDGDVTIENSTLDFSGATEGEIRFKKGLTLNVDETSNITACDIWTDATGANVNGTAVTGTEAEMATVTVVNGKVTIKMPVKGTLNAAYTSASYTGGVPAIFGEATGVVARDSFVVELYSDETLVGTAALVDTEKVLLNGVSKTITWHAALADDGDGWWKTEWTNDALNIKNIPDKAKLFVDGVEVSECDIQLNLSDSKNPIFAAVTDDKGNIQSFVAGTGFLNGTGANAPVYDDAFKAALDAGGNITLLRDVTLNNLIKVNGKSLTLDGNGHSISGTGTLWFEYGTYDIKNVVFGGIENDKNSILEFNHAKANVTGCTFEDNTGKNCVAVDTNAGDAEKSVVTIDGCTFTGNTCSSDKKLSSAVINNAAGTTIVKNSNITGNTVEIAVIYNSANLTATGNEFGKNTLNGENANKAAILTGPYAEGEYEVSITENAFLDAAYKAVYVENWAEEYSAVSTNDLSGNYWYDGHEPVNGEDYVAVEGANVILDDYYTERDAEGALSGLEIIFNGLSGSGTEEDPYLISSLEELKWFRDSVNTYTSDGSNQYKGKYVKLTADIDLEGENWTPIGTNSVGDHMAFLGTFDGGNHTISNLYINADGDHLGFFARVGSYGEGVTPTVKNITFNNVDVSTNGTDHWTTGHGDYVGGVIANAGGNSVVANVKVTGDVYVVGCGYVGGIVGHGYPDLTNCHVDANDGSYLNAYYWCAGGIIGYAGEGGTPITNCSVEGLDIWSDYGAAAAVAGLLQDNNTLTNVSAENVEITSNSDYCMGYIAGNGEASTLTNVTADKVTVTADGKEITSTDAVAEVDGVIYFDLQSAIDAAEDGDTVTLMRDVTVTEKLTVTKDVTLDLAGKTIATSNVTGSRVIVLENGCTEFVINANGGGISGDGKSLGLIDVNTAADVTVNGGTYNFDTNNGGLFKFRSYESTITLNEVTVDTNSQVSGPGYSQNTLVVNGGTFNGATTYSGHDYNMFYIAYGAKATFKDVIINSEYMAGVEAFGGEVTLINCDITVDGVRNTPYNSVAANVGNNGTLTINGGSYSATPKAASDANGQGSTHGVWALGVNNSGGTLVINGGTFTNGNYGDDSLATNARGLVYADTGATVEINGGTFNALDGIIDYFNNKGDATKNPVVTIKGGTYSADPESDWVKVAEGYVVEENEDGTYGVVIKKVPSATIPHGLQTIVNSEGRESVTFTLEDVYAESELKIELWSNDTKISTTTYNNGGVESSELTVNIVVAHGESGSWTTEWQIAPSVAYIPDQIVVYGDGEKVAEMIAPEGESVFYERYDSQLALYKALSGVYKAASVSDADGKVVDYYATAAEAIAAAEAGETVTMLTDVTGDVSVNKAGVTLDGNDKTITGKLSVTADGATVKNATVNNSGNAGYISAKDVLIENCTVTGSNGFRSCYTSGTVTFKDSTITGSTYGIHFDGSAGGNIVIDNCTITGWTSFASTIESVKIKDTEFADGNYDQLRFYQDVTLENVTFNPEMTIDFGKEGVTADFTDCSVTDGSALTEVIYLADIAEMGIKVTVDGEPIVVEASVTAGEDTAYYLTLEEALVAAVDGDVVTLLSDVELDESAVLNAEGTIVIDGNGKTVTQAEGYKDTQNGLLMLGGTTYGDAEAATHNYTIKNVVFDDIADWSVIRSQGVTLTVDGCTIQNAAQTNGQSLLRLDYTEATVKHTTFKNNNALMAITHNFNGNTSETKLLVEECVLEDNTFNKTAGIYYVIGGGATITKSEFVNNTVNCNNNGAVIYLGFQENCVVTDNLFKNNAVTDASTSTRVAGAIFFGYDAEITGNVFDNNTATNANGDVLGQVCTSVYYTDIDLSGNYFDGHEPVAGVDYTVQHQTSGNAWTVENYYTTYELDSDGNVVLDGLTEVVDPVASITVDGVTTEYATLTDAIAAADNGDVIEVLVADTYKLPSVSNKTFTIKGAAQDVVIDHKATVGMSGSDITFDSVTIECNTQMNYIGFHHAAAERYVNCVINGEMWTYGTEAVFTNCTFNQTSSGAYNLWTYGSSEVTLTGCTLNSAGKSVLLYNEGTVTATDLTVIDTEFVASTSVTGKAAIEIDTSLMSGVSNVTIDDATTATGFATGSISGNTLWNDKQDKTNINVYVDDEQVWPKNYVAQIGEDKYESLAEAIAAAEAGQTVTVIADITDEAVTVTKSVTITGDVTLTNVSITGSGTDVELTVSDLKFTGNSWINSNNIKKLTVSGVEANVTPSNSSATNSRSAFIALGRVEQNELELVIKNSAFNVTGGGDPVLGWAAITEATITGNTFGSADAYITNADAIKFMAIAANAVFNITGNTVYSNYNGFVFGQNTTRDNAYTVNVEDNDFYGSADHIWVEVSGSTTTHATIKATSDNTVNGNAFTAADIKTNVANWTSYAAVGAVLDSEGKLIGGTYTAKTSKDLVAEGYEAVDNEDGTWTVVEVPELPTATVTEIANDELTFALNFKADEATEEQLAYYGDWYADFVLTVNKDVTFNANGTADGYLSGQYDAWSENWVNVPFEDVTLEAGESIKILEYAKTLIPAWEDMEFTYDVVYNYVKDFNCGVFFTEEFLKANPDFVVTLELRMYNPDDVTESYVIGKTYEFEAPEIKDVAQVVDAEGNVVDTYTTLQKAIDAIVNGETEDNYTIELLSNVKENVVTDEESFTRVIITNGDKNYTLSGTLTLNGYAIVTIEADAKGDLTVNNELVRSEIKGADRHGYSTLPSGVGMINGAQIRYGSGVNDETGDVNSENGIRFIAKVGRTDTLVAFADMVKVEGGEIENIGIEIGATDSDVVVDIKASKYQNAAETIFTAALTNLSVTNYNRMFNAKAYVVVDGVKYVGDTTASRSIYQVSAGLLKKGADKVEGSDYTMNDALEEVLQAYVNHVGIRLTYDFENDSVTVRDNTASGAYTGDIFFAVESTKLDENNCVQITVKPYTTATEGDNKFNNPVVISEKLWKDYIRINNNNAVIKTLVEFVSHNTETGEFVFNFYPYGRPNAGTETVTE